MLTTRNMSFYMLKLNCTWKLIYRRVMKFLKINAKVLLILCLFSGILFLSTGCGDDSSNDSNPGNGSEVDNNQEDDNGDNQTDNNSDDGNDEEGNTGIDNNNGTSYNDNVDYSVWVANTTINTDKDQRSYKVIWGDTLWLISTAWDVSYQEIATFNNIPNPDLIYVDQIIYNPLFK